MFSVDGITHTVDKCKICDLSVLPRVHLYGFPAEASEQTYDPGSLCKKVNQLHINPYGTYCSWTYKMPMFQNCKLLHSFSLYHPLLLLPTDKYGCASYHHYFIGDWFCRPPFFLFSGTVVTLQ